MDRRCATCGETLPPSAFYATGIQRSCRACVRSQRDRAIRRSIRRRRRDQREAIARRQAELAAQAEREGAIAAMLARDIRAVVDCGHPERCIVWEPGPGGFCAFVTPDACPCETSDQHGDCGHRRAAAELLGTRTGVLA